VTKEKKLVPTFLYHMKEAALKFCFKTCVAMKFVDDDGDDDERRFILVFRHEEWLVGDYPLYLKFWAKLTSFVQKNDNFQSIFARSASAEKRSVNTNMKSTTRFSVSLR